MRYLLFSILVIFAIGVFAVPGAFAAHHEVTITNAPGSATPGCEPDCFIPSIATVEVGAIVTWDNTDTAAHTATAGSTADGPSGVFDSSLIMPGGSYSYTADTAGTFDYHCMVHPWMEGTIIVEDNTTTPTVTATAYLNGTSPTGRTLQLIADDLVICNLWHNWQESCAEFLNEDGGFDWTKHNTSLMANFKMPDGSFYCYQQVTGSTYLCPYELNFGAMQTYEDLETNTYTEYLQYSFPIPEDWEAGTYDVVWKNLGTNFNVITPVAIPALPGDAEEAASTLTMTNPRVVDAFGTSIATDEISVGQQVQIAADVTNNQSIGQEFAYVVMVRDVNNNTPVSTAWITGILDGGQGSLSPALSWTPDVSGQYIATIYLYESMDNKISLSDPVMIGMATSMFLPSLPASVDPIVFGTNKASYDGGDTITITGFVPGYVASDPMKNMDVMLHTQNENGGVVNVSQIAPDSSGFFNTSMIAGGAIHDPGTYTVEVNWNAQTYQTTFEFTGGSGGAPPVDPEPEAEVVMEETMDEEPESEPQQAITVSVNETSYYHGDVVQISGSCPACVGTDNIDVVFISIYPESSDPRIFGFNDDWAFMMDMPVNSSGSFSTTYSATDMLDFGAYVVQASAGHLEGFSNWDDFSIVEPVAVPSSGFSLVIERPNEGNQGYDIFAEMNQSTNFANLESFVLSKNNPFDSLQHIYAETNESYQIAQNELLIIQESNRYNSDGTETNEYIQSWITLRAYNDIRSIINEIIEMHTSGMSLGTAFDQLRPYYYNEPEPEPEPEELVCGTGTHLEGSVCVFNQSGIVYNAQGSSTPGCEPNCFIPNPITIDAGGIVTWINSDNAAHTATAGSAADGPSGVWDSSLIMAGGSYNHTFYTAGSYDYFCMVHPWMEGTVIVEGVSQSEPESAPEAVETEAEVVTESDEITTGSEIQIETDIVNQQDISQIFAYIVQIKYEDGTPLSISTITGSLAQGQTLTQTISWTPNEPGTYIAEIFIWDDIDSASPLSSVDVQYFMVT